MKEKSEIQKQKEIAYKFENNTWYRMWHTRGGKLETSTYIVGFGILGIIIIILGSIFLPLFTNIPQLSSGAISTIDTYQFGTVYTCVIYASLSGPQYPTCFLGTSNVLAIGSVCTIKTGWNGVKLNVSC